MKNTSILFLSLVCFVMGYAQSPRTVLLEHFTQASCGPCATFNPAVENYLNTTTFDMISVKYQASFPGTDPMYDFTTASVDNRQQYYTVNSVPRSVIDGNIHNGAPLTSTGGWSNTTIANRSAETSPFTITMDYDVSSDFETVNVIMTIEATQAFTGTALKAHLVVVEKEIEFCAAPGSNGETEFYYVMKQMLPNANGTDIPATWTAGQTEVITLPWSGASAYNPTQYAVIGFVQENTDKEILQAAVKEDYTRPHAVEAYNLGVSPCGGSLETCVGGTFDGATIEVVNLGTTAITALDIEYGLDGSTTNTYNWTGNIAPDEKSEITFPSVQSTIGESNLNFNIITTNGASDGYVGNNDKSVLVGTYNPSQTMTLELKTDRYASETTWKVRKEDGTVAYSGGPFPDLSSNTTTTQPPVTMILDPFECYYFELLDSYGDGICCDWGSGSFKITDDLGDIVAEGGVFQSEYTRAFTTQLSTDIEDVVETSSFNIFPNPVDGEFATVEFSVLEKSNVSIRVHSLLGDLIYEKNLGAVTSGLQQETLELTGVSNGVYMVTLAADNDVITKKISVLR